MSMITVVFYIIYVATQVGTNIWLSEWSNDKPEPDGTQDTALRDLRLGVYGALGGGQGNFKTVFCFISYEIDQNQIWEKDKFMYL